MYRVDGYCKEEYKGKTPCRSLELKPGAKAWGMGRIRIGREEHTVNSRCEQRPGGEYEYHVNTEPGQVKQMIPMASSYKWL